MTTALLDINVLLALAWPNHDHHDAAHRWFDEVPDRKWATCTLTQLGFIRISSNLSANPQMVSPQDAAAVLQELCAGQDHEFWSSPNAANPSIYSQAKGHQQVNDAWLVELARQNNGVLATLDKRLYVHDPSGKLVVLISALA